MLGSLDSLLICIYLKGGRLASPVALLAGAGFEVESLVNAVTET